MPKPFEGHKELGDLIISIPYVERYCKKNSVALEGTTRFYWSIGDSVATL
jgi:hypothetical protein